MAKGGAQLQSGRKPLPLRHRVGKHLKGRNDLAAQPFEPFGQLGVGRDFDRLQPGPSAPATRQRFVLQAVDRRVVIVHQPGLQSAEPVVVFPPEGHGAQRVTGQLRQRVIGDRLAPIEKERDLVTRKDTAYDIVVSLQSTENHRHVAEPPFSFLANVASASGLAQATMRTASDGRACLQALVFSNPNSSWVNEASAETAADELERVSPENSDGFAQCSSRCASTLFSAKRPRPGRRSKTPNLISQSDSEAIR